MNKLSILPFLVLLLACQPKEQSSLPLDTAGRATGTYTVQSLVVDGDTLYSVSGKNKLGTSTYYVQVGRLVADTVAVSYRTGVSNLPIINRASLPLNGARLVYIQEANNRFELSEPTPLPFAYESRIEANRFYERTVYYNLDSLQARWRFDSLKSPYTPPLREIIIKAEK